MAALLVCTCSLAVALTLAAGMAWAAPSGLLVIPTADVLGPGEASADFFSQGRSVLANGDCDRFLGVEVGLPHGVELGVDACLNDADAGSPWGNLKWQLPTAGPDRFAVALGLQNVGHGAAAQPYVTLAQAVGQGRAHAGVIRSDGATRLMLGAQVPAGETFELVSDYLSGPGGSAGLGFSWSPTPSWSLMVGRIWNRGAGSEHHWYFDVGYAFKAF